MANWFSAKEDRPRPYTILDKERDLKAFKFQLDLIPLCELWKNTCESNYKKMLTLTDNYRDFLTVMKEFYDDSNPFVKKFELILNKFQKDCEDYYAEVRESIDDALNEKRLELKSKD